MKIYCHYHNTNSTVNWKLTCKEWILTNLFGSEANTIKQHTYNKKEVVTFDNNTSATIYNQDCIEVMDSLIADDTYIPLIVMDPLSNELLNWAGKI